MPALVEHHVEQGHRRAHADAKDGAGRAHGQRVRPAGPGPQHQNGDHETCHHLEEDLQHLVHRGGEHVAVALAVAPVGGDHAHQQNGRGHGQHAGRGVRVFQIHGGKPAGEEEHDGGKEQAKHREGRQRHPEELLLLPGAAVGVRLRHQAGQGHGETRGGQGEEDEIDAVGPHEHGVALVTQDIAQGDLVEEAQDLHNDDAGSEDRRAVEIVLALLLSVLLRHMFCHVFCHSFLREK